MKTNVRFVSVVSLTFILFNLCSLLLDEDILSEFKDLNNATFKKVSNITVNEVFSNSFFFTSKKNLNFQKAPYYMIRHLEDNDIIYFKVNTIKFKDTLYFFQDIDWLTKKSKKIKSGKYEIGVAH